MDTINSEAALKPYTLIGVFVTLSALYFISNIVYKLYFHPLHHIPGPKINALSRIPYVRHALGGTTVNNVVALHEKYGEVVRISPNEISFTSGETAFPDIYGFRTGKLKGHLSMQKDPAWYAPPLRGVPSIITADDANHTRVRKILSHAFSEKALAQQETLLQQYVDQLVSRLDEVTSSSPRPVDMVKWYNWTTFDIIGDLTFGRPFGCLQALQTQDYVTLLFQSVEAFPKVYTMRYFPWVKYLGSLIIDPKTLIKRKEYTEWIEQQVKNRVAQDTQRPDFMTEILKHQGEKGESLSDEEMYINCQIMITAGSETTATLLSGATYLLLKNPEAMQKLKDEVRGRFRSYNDITIDALKDASYLIAVLSESLRYFPPVPAGFQRQVPAGGEIISGHFVPEDTRVAVSMYPTQHAESNFKDPEAFVPERWMGDPKYADDKRSSAQPFSFGPRACLGKNLAYAEMRLILAKIIWSYDLELDPKSENWMKECKVFTLWKKPELLIRVKKVERA